MRGHFQGGQTIGATCSRLDTDLLPTPTRSSHRTPVGSEGKRSWHIACSQSLNTGFPVPWDCIIKNLSRMTTIRLICCAVIIGLAILPVGQTSAADRIEPYVAVYGGITMPERLQDPRVLSVMLSDLNLALSPMYGAKVGFFQPGSTRWLGIETEFFYTTPPHQAAGHHIHSRRAPELRRRPCADGHLGRELDCPVSRSARSALPRSRTWDLLGTNVRPRE